MRMYELLPKQKKIWNIEQAYPHTDICNIGGYCHLEGKYDTDLLQKTVEIFVKTESVFWTCSDRFGNIFFKQIQQYHMDEYDFTNMDDKEISMQIGRWMQEPFDLDSGYLFDFRLLKCRDRVLLYAKFHHVILDGYAVALCAKKQEKI